MHEGSASIPDASPNRFYFATRNHLLAARRGAPLSNPLSRWGRCVSIVTLNVAHALRSYGGSRLARLGAVAAGVADFARRRYGAAGWAPRAEPITER